MGEQYPLSFVAETETSTHSLSCGRIVPWKLELSQLADKGCDSSILPPSCPLEVLAHQRLSPVRASPGSSSSSYSTSLHTNRKCPTKPKNKLASRGKRKAANKVQNALKGAVSYSRPAFKVQCARELRSNHIQKARRRLANG